VALEIPVPLETYVRTEDQSATLPSTFPAILKPNFGDSSIGITKDGVVSNPKEMIAALDQIRETLGHRPILVQEFLTGAEYTGRADRQSGWRAEAAHHSGGGLFGSRWEPAAHPGL